jgi:hypothetical protein
MRMRLRIRQAGASRFSTNCRKHDGRQFRIVKNPFRRVVAVIYNNNIYKYNCICLQEDNSVGKSEMGLIRDASGQSDTRRLSDSETGV